MKFNSIKISSSVSLCLFFLSFCFNLKAQINQPDSSNWGKLYITTWADDRQAAFSFSFDDGFKAQYDNVREILNAYDFESTHFILPPFLTDTLPGIWRYGTWQMFLQMAGEGYELGSHTLNHLYLTQLPVGDTLTPNTIHYELYHSKKMIEERYPYSKCISFAYPFADHNQLVDSLAGLYYENARVVGGVSNPPVIEGMEWLTLKSYQVEFDMPRDSLEDDLDELYDFINWIDTSISHGYWGIQLAHEVVPFEELADLISQGAYHPISNEWLILLCNWLKDKSDTKKIWIETIGNVTKYVSERQSFSYQILSQSNTLIEIELSDTLSDEIYDYPLSAYISIPENWKYALVEQGSETQVLESFFADSMQIILAKLIPDGGKIRLTEFEPNYVRDESYPDNYILYQNYPNPFNPVTVISYKLPVSSNVTLKVYDILGNEIATLVQGEKQAGDYTAYFDGRNLSTGIYIYTLRAGIRIQSRKMLLLR